MLVIRPFFASVNSRKPLRSKEGDLTVSERNLRKTRVGTVVSNKMDKTVVVSIADNVKHPLYKKDY